MSNEDTRRAVSRRLIKLSNEVSIMTEAGANVSGAESAYLQVYDADEEFLTQWLENIVVYYLAERQALMGYVPDTFTVAEAHLLFTLGYPDAADPIPPADPDARSKFFPWSSPFDVALDNKFMHPLIDTYTSHVPASYLTDYESKRAKDFERLSEVLINGFNGVGPNTTLTAPFTLAGTTVAVTNGIGIANDDVILISGDDGGGIPVVSEYVFLVNSGGGTNTLTGWIICGGPGNIALVNPTSVVVTGFSWVEANRANFPTAPGTPAGHTIARDYIITYMEDGLWGTQLTAEINALAANEDSRDPQATENTAAGVAATIAKAAHDTWLALASPGIRYQDAGLTPLNTTAGVRDAYLQGTRLAGLVTALGEVANAAGDTFSATGAIGLRYRALDRMVNKSYGSLAQYLNMGNTSTIMTQQKENAEAAQVTYGEAMIASALVIEETDSEDLVDFQTETDDSTKDLHTIYVLDASEFDLSKAIYVADEAQVELIGNILWVYEPDEDGVYRIDLSFEVSDDYSEDNLARAYQVL